VIRNVVIHILNEQPLLADLFGPPTASDAGLLCTNLRTPDGRRPVFIDSSEGIFFFPYLHIRFLEIPRGALDLPALANGDGLGAAAWQDAVPLEVAASRAHADAADEHGRLRERVSDRDPEGDLELDEDVLRRIRDI
jgi:hypothetical protein